MKANFQYIYVTIRNEGFWVINSTFHVKYGDQVAVADKHSGLLKRDMYLVTRRTNVKPLKGEPIYYVAAITNQFPVAENEQVVSCDHVAPNPHSIAVLTHEINVAEDQSKNILGRLEKIKGMINNG